VRDWNYGRRRSRLLLLLPKFNDLKVHMSEASCIVKIVDDHGVEHSVRIRAESVYEAAIRGLAKLKRHGCESDGSTIGWVTVEIHEEPTVHRIQVRKMLGRINFERNSTPG